MQNFSSDSSRWRAVQARDKSAHSAFVYAVVTTKIVCRPTCPSRLARRSNVKYYDTVTEALLDGFRSCKRCQPELPAELDHDAAAETVANACRLIESANGDIKIAELATATGFTTRHLHSLFKTKLGCTPSVYAAQVRQITKVSDTTLYSSSSVSTGSPMSVEVQYYHDLECQSDILKDSLGDPQVPPDGDTDIYFHNFAPNETLSAIRNSGDFEIQGHENVLIDEYWLQNSHYEYLIT